MTKYIEIPIGLGMYLGLPVKQEEYDATYANLLWDGYDPRKVEQDVDVAPEFLMSLDQVYDILKRESNKNVSVSEEDLRQTLNDSKLELVILSLPKEGDSRKLVAGMIVEQTEAISVLLQLSRMQIPAHIVLLPVSQTGNCVHKIEDFVSIYARIPE